MQKVKINVDKTNVYDIALNTLLSYIKDMERRRNSEIFVIAFLSVIELNPIQLL